MFNCLIEVTKKVTNVDDDAAFIWIMREGENEALIKVKGKIFQLHKCSNLFFFL
jgi:hypothetical protein